jgi:predicted Zn finger-like uncharacterized protein
MILTCPSCGTRYQTESALVAPPGRNVRCAKCGQVWFQAAPAPQIAREPEPVAVLAAEPQATPPPVAADAEPSEPGFIWEPGDSEPVSESAERDERPRRRVGWGQIAGWSVLILIVGAMSAAAIQYRQTVANLWPQTASVYAVLGMPVNTRGIALVNIAYRQEYEDGQPVLSVTGKVVNVSNRELPVPKLRVVLTDDAKHELYHWTFDVGVQTLEPGAESPFLTRLSSPPPDARNLNIRFADAGEGP